MREDLEIRLRGEAASFAAGFAPQPAAAIRARGDQRRRRAVALSAALTLAVLALGAGGAYAAIGGPGHAPVPATSHPPVPGGPTPAPTQPAQGGTPTVSGISCLTGADCWAVGARDFTGATTTAALTEHWNGQKWSDVPGTAIPGGLLGVACAQTNDCWATGSSYAAHWDGGRWVTSDIHLPARSTFDVLATSVACPSADSCWTVGDATFRAGKSERIRPLAEHWDGRAWSPIAAPGVSRTSVFRSVACASAADCWAVGYWSSSHGAKSGDLTEHWDGSAWSVVRNPASTTPGDLFSVSCAPNGACVAVGDPTLAERWTGAGWALTAVPLPPRAKNAELDSVSCPTRRWCLAVGAVAPRSGPVRALSEIWNGAAWTIAPSPKPTGSPAGPTSVTCTSSTDCWALGTDGFHSAMEHWDGATWSLVVPRA